MAYGVGQTGESCTICGNRTEAGTIPDAAENGTGWKPSIRTESKSRLETDIQVDIRSSEHQTPTSQALDAQGYPDEPSAVWVPDDN